MANIVRSIRTLAILSIVVLHCTESEGCFMPPCKVPVTKQPRTTEDVNLTVGSSVVAGSVTTGGVSWPGLEQFSSTPDSPEVPARPTEASASATVTNTVFIERSTVKPSSRSSVGFVHTTQSTSLLPMVHSTLNGRDPWVSFDSTGTRHRSTLEVFYSSVTPPVYGGGSNVTGNLTVVMVVGAVCLIVFLLLAVSIWRFACTRSNPSQNGARDSAASSTVECVDLPVGIPDDLTWDGLDSIVICESAL